jgi:hypothetical protein
MRMKNAQSVLTAVLTAGCVLAGTREASAAVVQSTMVGAQCYGITAQSAGYVIPHPVESDSLFVDHNGIENTTDVGQAVMCPLAVVGNVEIEEGVIWYYNRSTPGDAFTCVVTLVDPYGDLMETIPFAGTSPGEGVQTFTFTPTVESVDGYVSCFLPVGGNWVASIDWTSH